MGQRESRRNIGTKIFLIKFSHFLLGFWGEMPHFLPAFQEKKL